MKYAPYVWVIVSAVMAGVTTVPVDGAPWTKYFDLDAFEEAAGPLTPIDFTGFEDGTIIGEQYSDLGITWVEEDEALLPHIDTTDDPGGANWPDGAGLVSDVYSGLWDMYIVFDEPIRAFGYMQLAGSVTLDFLDANGEPLFTTIAATVFPFVGFETGLDFSAIRIRGDGQAHLDNIYFRTIPAPPGLAIFGVLLFRRGRRRHSRSPMCQHD